MLVSPNYIADCICWLDGSDVASLFQDTGGSTVVTTNGQGVKRWTNKATSATVHATEGTNPPTYATGAQNGKSGLLFDGSNDFLRLTGLLSSAQDEDLQIYVVSKGGDTTNRVLLGAGVSSGAFWYERNGSVPGDNWAILGGAAGAETFVIGEAAISGWGYDGKAYRVSVARHGARATVNGSATLNPRRVPATGSLGFTGNLDLGRLYNGGFNWSGHILEVVIFGRLLTEREDALMMEYLGYKWDIATRPYVLCIGDSLTGEGYAGAGNGYPAQLETLLGGTTLVESRAGDGGYLPTAFPLALAWAECRAWPDASGGKLIAVVWLGANDLPVNTVEEWQAGMISHAKALRQMGYAAVVAITIMPRVTANQATFNTRRPIANDWLNDEDGGRQHFAGVVDLTAIPELEDNADTDIFVDGTHLNAAGNALVAAAVKEVIDTLSSTLTVPAVANVRTGVTYMTPVGRPQVGTGSLTKSLLVQVNA